MSRCRRKKCSSLQDESIDAAAARLRRRPGLRVLSAEDDPRLRPGGFRRRRRCRASGASANRHSSVRSSRPPPLARRLRPHLRAGAAAESPGRLRRPLGRLRNDVSRLVSSLVSSRVLVRLVVVEPRHRLRRLDLPPAKRGDDILVRRLPVPVSVPVSSLALHPTPTSPLFFVSSSAPGTELRRIPHEHPLPRGERARAFVGSPAPLGDITSIRQPRACLLLFIFAPEERRGVLPAAEPRRRPPLRGRRPRPRPRRPRRPRPFPRTRTGRRARPRRRARRPNSQPSRDATPNRFDSMPPSPAERATPPPFPVANSPRFRAPREAPRRANSREPTTLVGGLAPPAEPPLPGREPGLLEPGLLEPGLLEPGLLEPGRGGG